MVPVEGAGDDCEIVEDRIKLNMLLVLGANISTHLKKRMQKERDRIIVIDEIIAVKARVETLRTSAESKACLEDVRISEGAVIVCERCRSAIDARCHVAVISLKREREGCHHWICEHISGAEFKIVKVGVVVPRNRSTVLASEIIGSAAHTLRIVRACLANNASFIKALITLFNCVDE